ncbi:M48 family metalloprotease [Candidatus Uhrbacteria bacterium]|nr:M48 family metalloprotease [Candidatus Uhrbacteria bacterium]
MSKEALGPIQTPNVSPKPERSEREGLRRTVALERKRFEFEYGAYPENHPVQNYVQSVADRLNKIGLEPHVQVAPDWHEMNAVAFPDGTLLVASRLVERAQTEQALLGVIAHELVHVQKTHNAKQREKKQIAAGKIEGPKPDVSGAIHNYLQSLSLERMHEYDADLRGAVKWMDEAGENPMGYKQLLERMFERDPSKTVSHGTSRDRALNIAETTFAVHLPSTSQPLTPISEDIRKTISEDKKIYSYRDVASRPSLLYSNPESVKESRERQLQALERLPDDMVSIAIEKLSGKLLRTSETVEKEDVAVLRKLIERFVKKIPAEERLQVELAPALISLVCGMDIKNGLIQVGPKPVKNAKRTAEVRPTEAIAAPEVLEAATKPWPADPRVQGEVKRILDERAYPYASRSQFGFQAGMKYGMASSDMETKVDAVKAWAPILTDWSKAYSVHTSKNEQVIDSLRETLELPKEALIEKNKPLSVEQIQDKEVRDWITKTEHLKDFQKAKNLARALAAEFLENKESVQVEDLASHLRSTFLKVNEYVSSKTQKGNFEQAEIADRKIRLLTTAGYEWLKTALALPECHSIPLPEKEEALFLYYWLNGLENVRVLATQEISDEDPEYGYKMDNKEDPEFNKQAKYLEKEVQHINLLGRLDRDRATRLIKRLDPDFTKLDVAWGTLPQDFEQSLQEEYEDVMRTRIAVRHLLSIEDPQALSKEVVRLEGDANYRAREEFVRRSIETGPILERLVLMYKKGEFKKLSLAEGIELVSIVPDPALRDQWEKRLLNDRWSSVGFVEKLDTLFPEGRGSGVTDFNLRERFLDEQVDSQETFTLVKKRVEGQLDEMLKEGSSSIGAGLLLEKDFRHTEPREIVKTMLALLKSSEDDTELRKVIFNRVVSGPQYSQKFGEEVEAAAIVSDCESALRTIYSIGPVGRHALLRKILTSEGGLLPDPQRRKIFLESLFKEWIKPTEGENDLEQVLERVRGGLVDVKDWELLYIAFQGSLGERIARPPKRRSQASEWLTLDDTERISPESALLVKTKKLVDWKSVPAGALSNMDRYRFAYREYSQRIAYDLLGAGKPEVFEAMTPLRFVKDTVQRMSAMGVRFLQNLPLAADIPEKYAQEFNEVFDQAKGQSKISALLTMEREWPTMWDEIARFGKRIGGGSIVTVYEVEATDGRKEVVKILNPNIKHHIDGMYGLAKDVIGSLAKNHGGGYESANVLLDDMKEWIAKDVAFENFLENDKRFFERHQGYKPEGHRYGLRIPRSRGPENAYFSREEYIPGTNLTQWKQLEKKGHDMRQVISVITKSYIEQIAHGQALSDIHIGNFSVTPKGEIAVYDRNFFLHLSPQERVIVSQFINPFADISAKEEMLAGFVAESGGVMDEQTRLEVHRLADASSRHDWQEGLRAMTAIKRRGVRIPLNITLLLKNFHALQRMAIKSGMNGVMDAYLYTP